jgi:hypothetical protein
MTTRLHVGSITSIGAVEAGDNPEADILFFKIKPPTEDQTPDPEHGQPIDKEGSVPETFDTASLSEEAQAYVSDLETKLAELTGEPEALPDDLPEVVKSRLDSQDELIAKAQAEKEQIAKDLAELQDGMATEKYMTRAKALEVLLGDPVEMAPVLKELAAGAPDAFAKLDAQFNTLVSMKGYDSLLKEFGDSSATGSAIDQINAYTKEIKTANPDLSMAKARAQAWTEHPELKEQARAEGVS